MAMPPLHIENVIRFHLRALCGAINNTDKKNYRDMAVREVWAIMAESDTDTPSVSDACDTFLYRIGGRENLYEYLDSL